MRLSQKLTLSNLSVSRIRLPTPGGFEGRSPLLLLFLWGLWLLIVIDICVATRAGSAELQKNLEQRKLTVFLPANEIYTCSYKYG